MSPTGALSYSTYLGGSGNDYGRGVAVDIDGNPYVAGLTGGVGFPTAGPLQLAQGGAFVTKLGSAGDTVRYSTVLGGAGAAGIAVDNQLSAHVVGAGVLPPRSPVPTVSNGFAVRLSPAGDELWYSTPVGDAASEATGVAVDRESNAYVVGNRYGTFGQEAFVARLDGSDRTEPDTTLQSVPPQDSASNAASFAFASSEPSPSSRFECKLDASAFAACASPATYSALAQGSHSFRVRAIDAFNNVDSSPAAYTWNVDSMPPDTMMEGGPPAVTNAISAELTFSSPAAGATFECRVNNSPFASCTSPKAYSGLAEGAQIFEVRATDPAGNTDVSPATRTWTVDLTPPDTEVDSSPLDPSGETTAVFAFHSEQGAAFTCRLDAAPTFIDCATPKTYASLSEGNHVFRVAAIDQAGNVDPTPVVVAWRIEVAPPQTTITGGPSGLWNAAGATFEFEADEPASFSCTVDATVTPGCTSPFAVVGLADGPHTLSVTATDLAGKVDASPAVRTWTIDTVAPVAAVPVSPAGGAVGVAPGVSLRFSRGSDAGAGLASESVTLDGQMIATLAADASCPGEVCMALPPAPLTSGSHTWQVVTKDKAGNVASLPSRSFVVDADAPVWLTLVSPVGVRISDARPTLSWWGAIDAGSGVARYAVRIDARELDTEGTSVQVPAPLSDGSHTWRVVAIDRVGNRTQPVSGTFIVDTTPPVARLDVGPKQTRPGVSVTLDARASSDADGRVVAYAFDTDGDGSFEHDAGTASMTSTSFSAPGAYRVGVRVTDEAGLAGTAVFDVRIVGAGTVIIGQGAAAVFEPRRATGSRKVKLVLTPPSGSTAVRISNDNDPNQPDIFRLPLSGPQKVTTDWTLDRQTSPGKESKEVFVWFERGTDLVYSSPSIILDEVPPIVTLAVSSAKGKPRARVKVKARDKQGTGVKRIRISRKTCSGPFRPIAPARIKNGVATVTTKPPGGRGVLRVQVRDAVANSSRCVKVRTAR